MYMVLEHMRDWNNLKKKKEKNLNLSHSFATPLMRM